MRDRGRREIERERGRERERRELESGERERERRGVRGRMDRRRKCLLGLAAFCYGNKLIKMRWSEREGRGGLERDGEGGRVEVRKKSQKQRAMR